MKKKKNNKRLKTYLFTNRLNNGELANTAVSAGVGEPVGKVPVCITRANKQLIAIRLAANIA